MSYKVIVAQNMQQGQAAGSLFDLPRSEYRIMTPYNYGTVRGLTLSTQDVIWACEKDQLPQEMLNAIAVCLIAKGD